MKIIRQVDGDLNKDGMDDTVLILGQENETLDENDHDRLLMILFHTNREYVLAVSTSKAILCFHCGGLMGDPLESVSIKKGILNISHFGGSRERWTFLHRFRFQNGHFILIGKKSILFDSITGMSEMIDENLVTGERIEKKEIPGKKTKIVKFKSLKKPAQNLESFSFQQP